MKLLKLLVCLLVVSSLVMEISASRNLIQRARKQQKKDFLDSIRNWVFGNFNDVEMEVSRENTQVQTFTAQVKHSFLDAKKTVPFALEFQNYQVGEFNSQNGFIQNVLARENVEGTTGIQNSKIVLDLRQVKACAFSYEKVSRYLISSAWVMKFEAYSNEERHSNIKSKQTWDVRMTMPGAWEKEFQTIRQQLTQACELRNKQVYDLKQGLISSANKYSDLLKLEKTKTQYVESKEIELKVNDKKFASVKAQTEQDSQWIQDQLAKNKKTLSEVQAAVSTLQAQSQDAQADVTAQSNSLTQVNIQIQGLKQRQSTLTGEISEIQKQLNEAIALRNSHKSKAEQVAQEKQKMEKFVETEKAELNRLLKENDERMKKLAEELAKVQEESRRFTVTSENKQSEYKGKIEKKAAEGQQVEQQVQQAEQTVEQLQKKLQLQELEAARNKEQRETLESSAAAIENLLNQKRTAAQQLEARLQEQTALQAQKDKDFTDQEAKQRAQLEKMQKQREESEARLNFTKQEAEKAKAESKAAFDQLLAAYGDFNKAINAIANIARAAGNNAKAAYSYIYNGQDADALSSMEGIVVQSPALVKKTYHRMAKQIAEINRLAKIYKTQAKRMRMQKKAHKKANKKVQKKSHKKAHKKADN